MPSIGDEAFLLLIIPDIGANGPAGHDGNDDNKENDAIKSRTNGNPQKVIAILKVFGRIQHDNQVTLGLCIPRYLIGVILAADIENPILALLLED